MSTIDPGHPFSKPFRDIVAEFETRIRQGVEQVGEIRHIYKKSVPTYELPLGIESIVQVTGLVNGRFARFEPAVDYSLQGSSLHWKADARRRPDDGSRIDVEYIFRERPTGLNDFNAGSVIGTLVRAVSREMKLIYEQMDEAYRRAFIDQATGVGLDNVVALLGIQRNEATKAQGHVEFFVNSAANREVEIPVGTQIADESGRSFITTVPAKIAEQTSEVVNPDDDKVVTAERIGEVIAITLADDPQTTYGWQKSDPRRPFGVDERTILLAPDARPVGPVKVEYTPRSVTVPVMAEQEGPNGNVNARAVVLMPAPPPGVDGVVNREPITGGYEPEADAQLRDRAKHALERAGNATLDAIKYAVLEVDGVEGVEVIDHSLDDSIQLGEVHVRYTGGARDKVKAQVERTRAAGVFARLEEIAVVAIVGQIVVLPLPNLAENTLDAAAALYRHQVIADIKALGVGEGVAVRKLAARVFDFAGLADVAEVRLYKAGETLDKKRSDDVILPHRAELLRPDELKLQVVVARALNVSSTRRSQDTYRIAVQLLNNRQEPIPFGYYTLEINVTLRAALRNESGLERIGSFTKRVEFSGSSTASLAITADDLSRYRADEHKPEVEVTLTAAAYAGVQNARTTILVADKDKGG